MMSDFEEMYMHLFNCVTNAIRRLEWQDPAEAKRILIAAQQECEEMYIGNCYGKEKI